MHRLLGLIPDVDYLCGREHVNIKRHVHFNSLDNILRLQHKAFSFLQNEIRVSLFIPAHGVINHHSAVRYVTKVVSKQPFTDPPI